MTDGSRPATSTRYWIVAIVALTLLAYLPALGNGWIWDDNHYVTENVDLHTLHGLSELWFRPGAVPQYYPVTHTTFWIEYHFWGLHPFGYHLDNVLLHAANAVMVGLILRRLAVPGYVFAAAIFAVHPVEVESVAWVTERKNVLSGLFYFLSLWQALEFWRIAPSQQTDETKRFNLRSYLLCLGFFLLAILSKSVTSSLPAIVLLLTWWKRGRIRLADVILLIPFFVFGAAMGSVTSWMERHVVGAIGPEWNWTFWQRCLIAVSAVWFYLAKLVWPSALSFAYHAWPLDGFEYVEGALLILLVALALLQVRKGRRAPMTALLFFIISLFPALGFVDVYPMRYSFVADHFQYLASIGPIAVAAFCLRRPSYALPLLVLFGVLTWRQTRIYADQTTLWRDVVVKDDRSAIGHTNLAEALLADGQVDAAETQAHLAAKFGPQMVEAQIEPGLVAEARNNLNDAIEIYRQATSRFPDSPLPHWHLGLLHRRLGDLDQAKLDFAGAAARLPNPAPAYEQIGEIELSRQRMAEAIRQFVLALASDPDRVDAHDNLAAIDLSTSQFDLAKNECRAALDINPDDDVACNNLGIALARQGQTDAAAGYFRRALRIDPNFTEAKVNLAKIGAAPGGS